MGKSATRLLGPAVRLMLSRFGIKQVDVEPTGPKNNLLKGDVLSHIHEAK